MPPFGSISIRQEISVPEPDGTSCNRASHRVANHGSVTTDHENDRRNSHPVNRST
jgi:hypothetical protein